MATWEGAERIKRIFESADTNLDGKLSREELKKVLKEVSMSQWDDETLDSLMEQCDYNKDAHLQVGEFIDFLFRGTKQEREIGKGNMLTVVRLMAMHSSYYEDLKPKVDGFFHKHNIRNVDLNHEEEWEKALPYCQENEVDVVIVGSDAIRAAVADDATMWYERDRWFAEKEMPEDKLFEIMPFLKEIIHKSKNPVIAVHPWMKDVGSQAASLDRITSQLRHWRDGMKERLKNYSGRLEQKERFEARVGMMEAMIEASEAEEAAAKDKDIAAFRPLFNQIADKEKWDEKTAETVFAHLVRGNMYTETWYIEAFTEGSVEKYFEKIGVEPLPEAHMAALTDYAFGHNALASTVRSLAEKTGWDLNDQRQVVHKLRRVGCVENRSLQVAIKTKNLNPRLKKLKYLPFGEKSLAILEGWAEIYAASHSFG